MRRSLLRDKASVYLVLLVLLQFVANAQHDPQGLIASADFKREQFTRTRHVTYLFNGKNAFVKYNPVSLVFGGLLMVYQKTISVQIGAACPYEISCSTFSGICIRKYGLLKGIALTADRLTRCTRLAFFDMAPGVDYSNSRGRIFDNPDDYRRR